MSARKERARVLALQDTIAGCIMRAADAARRDRDLARLILTIKGQEKEHRAGGVKFGARTRYAPMAAAISHFLCRVVSDGIHVYRCGEAPIATLSGVRPDYVLGALLCSDRAFLDRLVSEVRAKYPDDSPEDMIKRAGSVNYGFAIACENKSAYEVQP